MTIKESYKNVDQKNTNLKQEIKEKHEELKDKMALGILELERQETEIESLDQ